MSPVRVRGIIFDYDGVMVDSEPIRFKAGARALEEIGVSLTWEGFLAVWLGRTDQAGRAGAAGRAGRERQLLAALGTDRGVIGKRHGGRIGDRLHCVRCHED